MYLPQGLWMQKKHCFQHILRNMFTTSLVTDVSKCLSNLCRCGESSHGLSKVKCYSTCYCSSWQDKSSYPITININFKAYVLLKWIPVLLSLIPLTVNTVDSPPIHIVVGNQRGRLQGVVQHSPSLACYRKSSLQVVKEDGLRDVGGTKSLSCWIGVGNERGGECQLEQLNSIPGWHSAKEWRHQFHNHKEKNSANENEPKLVQMWWIFTSS